MEPDSAKSGWFAAKFLLERIKILLNQVKQKIWKTLIYLKNLAKISIILAL